MNIKMNMGDGMDQMGVGIRWGTGGRARWEMGPDGDQRVAR